jgi:hypothetical protein
MGFVMTREQVKEVLERVLTWPPERQEDAAEILMSIEAQDKSGYRLSDDQLAELQRRRAEKDPKSSLSPNSMSDFAVLAHEDHRP